MLKNRVIPFGYCMKNGEITTEPKEVYAVATIFSEYLNGKSLLQIAKLMESEKIRYNSDSDHWNKNMVKRIIENEKYLGTDKYPQLIDEDIFRQANEKWFCQYHLTHFIRTRIMQRERYDHSRAFFELPEAAHRWRCRFFCWPSNSYNISRS